MKNEINISFKELIDYIRDKDMEIYNDKFHIEKIKKDMLRYRNTLDRIYEILKSFEYYIPDDTKEEILDIIERCRINND